MNVTCPDVYKWYYGGCSFVEKHKIPATIDELIVKDSRYYR
jgi:hypothetical protein